MAFTGACMVLFLCGLALLAPWITPQDPFQQNLLNRLQAPSFKHWFGTDELGRDVFSRLLMGTRISLSIGFLAAFISIFIGTLWGLVSGYWRGWMDAILMRFVDVMLCFPTLFLILMILAVMDKPSLMMVMIIIGLTSWPGLARMVRGEVLSLRERDFMLAAKGLGLSTPRLLLVHMLPNVVSPVLVAATFSVGSAILTESALSFLGLGVQPPAPSWGSVLTSGKDFIHVAWWLSVFPGIAILVTVLAFNLIGEGLRDALDPRL
ncbi:MAG: Glutathione transport system permease protein GsiD [Elusimicrobia bacterium]|nr:Glutathione transport system permease protein GsiD [Elusimicrobiota bacterium]